MVSSEKRSQKVKQVRQQDAHPANAGGGAVTTCATPQLPFSKATSQTLIV